MRKLGVLSEKVLAKACREVLAWRSTGILKGDTLIAIAEEHFTDYSDALQQAETMVLLDAATRYAKSMEQLYAYAGRRMEYGLTLYHFDRAMLFTGSLYPSEEGDPNIFMLVDDPDEKDVFLASSCSEEMLAELIEGDVDVRSVFEVPGAVRLVAGAGRIVLSSTVYDDPKDIPADCLSEPGARLGSGSSVPVPG
jgi:hypothetical protein